MFVEWWNEAFAPYKAQGKLVPDADIHHILNLGWLTRQENADKSGTLISKRRFQADLLDNYDKLEAKGLRIMAVLNGQAAPYRYDDTASVRNAMGTYTDMNIAPALSRAVGDSSGFCVIADDVRAAFDAAVETLSPEYRKNVQSLNTLFSKHAMAVIGLDGKVSHWSFSGFGKDDLDPDIRLKAYTNDEMQLIRLMEFRDALQSSPIQHFADGKAYTELKGLSLDINARVLMDDFGIVLPPEPAERPTFAAEINAPLLESRTYLRYVDTVNKQIMESLNAYFNHSEIDLAAYPDEPDNVVQLRHATM